MIRILILAWTLHLMINSIYGLLLQIDHPRSRQRFYNEMEWNPLAIVQQRSDPRNNNQPWSRNTRYYGFEPEMSAVMQNRFSKNKYSHYGQMGNFEILKEKQGNNTTEMETFNGFDNILNDIGIMSLVVGIIGVLFGIITDGFSIGGIVISILSVLWAGGPSSVLALLNRFVAFENQLLSNIVEVTGMLDTFLNIFFNIRFSMFTTLVSHWGNVASVISILLGIVALFPEELEDGLNYVYGKEFVKQYGCNNPFSELVELISNML